MNLIQEAIEAAETQDLCGNHNSADLLRRLARELEDARLNAIADERADGPFVTVSLAAKRREAGE